MQFPERPTPTATPEDGQFQKRVLRGLQQKHVYAGTVPPAEVARRRAKNKAARKSRRRNR